MAGLQTAQAVDQPLEEVKKCVDARHGEAIRWKDGTPPQYAAAQPFLLTNTPGTLSIPTVIISDTDHQGGYVEQAIKKATFTHVLGCLTQNRILVGSVSGEGRDNTNAPNTISNLEAAANELKLKLPSTDLAKLKNDPPSFLTFTYSATDVAGLPGWRRGQ